MFKKLIKSVRGQGMMEYMIISGLIGAACLVAFKELGSSVNTRVKQMEKKVIKHVKIN